MFGRKHFAPEGEGAGGGAPPAVVPVAAPVAAPPAAAALPVAAPPVAVAPPVAAAPPAAAPPAPAATPPAVDPATDPAWFKPRLEREALTARNKTLAELGVTDLAAAKAAIASASAAADANRSAEERALAATGQLTAARAENERLASITREHAGRMLGVLTAEQQSAVRALSPDTDPAGQLHAVSVLGPTWAASQAAIETARAAATAAANAAALAAAPPVAAPPVATPPATTAPGATAPAGGPAASPPDHKSVYQTARAANPFAAAAYGLANPTEVYGPKA